VPVEKSSSHTIESPQTLKIIHISSPPIRFDTFFKEALKPTFDIIDWWLGRSGSLEARAIAMVVYILSSAPEMEGWY
jgi:hypothetical protein